MHRSRRLRYRGSTLLEWVAVGAVLWTWFSGISFAEADDRPNFERWEKEIATLEQRDREQPPQPNGILFVGSSSIRLWNLSESFPDFAITNHGFGGSQIVDSTHFSPRIIIRQKPQLVVLYAGDNDIAAGKSPDEVRDDFEAFARVIRSALPATRIAFISIKPSIRRWELWKEMKRANELIEAYCREHDYLGFIDVSKVMLDGNGEPRQELFIADGLHLNVKGYEAWTRVVKPHLKRD